MWDLIVSVPDHCLSFYFVYTRKQPCVSFNKHAINGQLQTMRDPLLLKYDIIIICHFSHDCVKHPGGRTSGSATAWNYPKSSECIIYVVATVVETCDMHTSVTRRTSKVATIVDCHGNKDDYMFCCISWSSVWVIRPYLIDHSTFLIGKIKKKKKKKKTTTKKKKKKR